MCMDQAVIESYARIKNLKLVGDEVGIKWQKVYTILRANGISVTGDKRRYGGPKDKTALIAEDHFKRLVPEAVDLNESKYQAEYDFDVHGLKVDVKAAHKRRGMKRSPILRWAFSIKKQTTVADFFVFFALTDSEPRTFLIPAPMVSGAQSISITASGASKWHDFEVQPGELAAFFLDLSRQAKAA